MGEGMEAGGKSKKKPGGVSNVATGFGTAIKQPHQPFQRLLDPRAV